VGQPRIITRGFVYAPDAEDLLTRAENLVRTTASVKRGTAPGKVEERVERALSSFFYQETKRRPLVTVAMMEMGQQETKGCLEQSKPRKDRRKKERKNEDRNR
jgi:ribonuclease J